jgi:hypothetical protein
MHFRPALLTAATGVVLVAGTACGAPREGKGGARPPVASFLVVAGDSTFWVRTSDSGTAVRRAPMLLTRLEGRLYELYLADDDRSYYDAVFVGQLIFRRDLVTGDSTLVLDDPDVREAATSYAARHPDEEPLEPDEPENPDAGTVGTTDTEIVEVLGPYLTYEQHVDFDGPSVRAAHTTRRGVIDLRTGHPVSLGALVGDDGAGALYVRAAALFGTERDSIRRSRDARARRAQAALGGLVFDSASFSLVESFGAPAVSFFVPGRGAAAGGYALPLSPIPIQGGAWWREARAALPTPAPGGDDVWADSAYEVAARYDASGEAARLVLRGPAGAGAARREWTVTTIPVPVRRLFRVSTAPNDSLDGALRQAFDDAVLYDGDARTAAGPARRLPPPAGSLN